MRTSAQQHVKNGAKPTESHEQQAPPAKQKETVPDQSADDIPLEKGMIKLDQIINKDKFQPRVFDTIVCQICKQVPGPTVKSTLCGQCHQLFCESQFLEEIQKQNRCPTCKKLGKPFMTNLTPETLNRLRELMI